MSEWLPCVRCAKRRGEIAGGYPEDLVVKYGYARATCRWCRTLELLRRCGARVKVVA